jgi:hypothetical protein
MEAWQREKDPVGFWLCFRLCAEQVDCKPDDGRYDKDDLPLNRISTVHREKSNIIHVVSFDFFLVVLCC